MFSRILVPFDGSAHSMKAVETAIELARTFDSDLTFLHVTTKLNLPDQLKDYIRGEQLAGHDLLAIDEATKRIIADISVRAEARPDHRRLCPQRRDRSHRHGQPRALRAGERASRLGVAQGREPRRLHGHDREIGGGGSRAADRPGSRRALAVPGRPPYHCRSRLRIGS